MQTQPGATDAGAALVATTAAEGPAIGDIIVMAAGARKACNPFRSR